jgi:hypothetical protein
MSQSKGTVWLALAALVAVALGVGAYFLFYAPLLDARAQAAQEAQTVEEKNSATETELAALAKDAVDLDAKKAQLAESRAQFPAGLDEAEFTRYLTGLLEGSAVTLQDLQVESPTPVGAPMPLPLGPGDYRAPQIGQPPSNMYQFPVTISVKGDMGAAYAFLEALQEDTGRMFMVSSTDVTADDTVDIGETTNIADLEIKGYVYALIQPDQNQSTAD